MTYRSFLELTVNTVPLNPKAVTCIGLGLGCRGARSANNRTNTQQLNICYCWTRVGISSSPHIFFSTHLDISLCKTVIGFLYWMVLETYSISWGNDSGFFIMLIFWLLLVSSGVNIDLYMEKKQCSVLHFDFISLPALCLSIRFFLSLATYFQNELNILLEFVHPPPFLKVDNTFEMRLKQDMVLFFFFKFCIILTVKSSNSVHVLVLIFKTIFFLSLFTGISESV